jgi:hypothetical protein
MADNAIIARLRSEQAGLNALGVAALGVFGSVARGEDGPASDVDLIVRFAPGRDVSLLDIVHIERRLAEALGRPVQVVTEPIGRASLRARIEADRVAIF